MPGMADFLKQDVGPLPMWAWAGIGTAGLAGYLLYRKNQQAKAAQAAAQQQASGVSSNLGTVPLSNLTTQAQPMPIQLGDTFVNVPPGTASSMTTPNQISSGNPPSIQMQPAGAPPVSPAAANMQVSAASTPQPSNLLERLVGTINPAHIHPAGSVSAGT